MKESVNLLAIKGLASLINRDKDEVVEFTIDQTFFRILNPQIIQNTNMFFKKSIIHLDDYMFDVFGWY